MSDKTLSLLQDLLHMAKAAGADTCDAVLSDSSSLTVGRRLGKQESLQRSEEAAIGLRVFLGRKSAIVSSSDRSPAALKEIADRAVSMARYVPEDMHAGIADISETTKHFPDLDLHDKAELSAEAMNSLADAAESAALEVTGVTNSEGATCDMGHGIDYYVASNGFVGSYASSSFSLSVAAIAGESVSMEVGDDFDWASHLSDLKDAASIGREAGLRAVKALNAKRAPTGSFPVVFDRRTSGGIIGSLASAVSGGAVARGTTMLKDMMGKQVFGKHITILDDPFLKRGARSRPFDGEGVAPLKRAIIENGVLTGWLLDLASARKLGLQTTGNAARGASAPPSPRAANFYMQPGEKRPEEMIRDIKHGLFVTSLMGSGANIVTGDYSRGAKGFWIENGEIAYPVSELTIAGNLKDMWMNLTPANDLQLKYGVDTPTLLIESMTVAGG